MNATPSGERVHIGFFGRRNAGKSSLVNAVTGQDLAVVSPVKGTTTDPVRKAMELLPLGPVLIIDTPGLDDEGALGELRMRKTRQVLHQSDIAVLVVDAALGKSPLDEEVIRLLKDKKLRYIVAYNKCDLLSEIPPAGENEIYLSAGQGTGIQAFKERIAVLTATEEAEPRIVGDLLHPGDFVVLVVPIDTAAPKGRLILPQQQTIRDILEADAAAIVVKESELKETLAQLGRRPNLVITDSQVFAKVAAETPPDIPLTSFSILMARHKGVLDPALRGVRYLDALRDGDAVLICEGCTHHRQCDDIGTVKLPRWIKQYSGVQPEFSFTSGREFPEDLSPYRWVIHCGGCMLNDREMKHRQASAEDQKVPFTNYGILIAALQGILKRSVASFPHLNANPPTEARPRA
jgi:[FeFe] hydrogenase H-cluster maturation GTPase HydF